MRGGGFGRILLCSSSHLEHLVHHGQVGLVLMAGDDEVRHFPIHVNSRVRYEAISIGIGVCWGIDGARGGLVCFDTSHANCPHTGTVEIPARQVLAHHKLALIGFSI